MFVVHFLAEQYKTLPILVNHDTCSGKVYIVTGANAGLGLETARHLVRCSAARVILAVRNLTAGEEAKLDIERTTGRNGVAEVWHLDLASFASVQAFAAKASSELEQLDGFVANAGILLDKFGLSEGYETSMTVDVISTMLLSMLMMPKLVESARRSGTEPHLVFVVSALRFTAQKGLAKGGQEDIFKGLNDEKRANMDSRFALTKLVEMYAVREFASLLPADKTGVIINMVSPGLCSTGLGREARTWIRASQDTLRALMARTAEQGSRTILHGAAAGRDSHGTHLSGCEIKEYWLPKWMTDADGQRKQKQIWKELVAKMEAVKPGCTTAL
ncbi:hypothetical protein B0T17DRAFT_491013 [Bombardia bombarda]|uniref:Uncharacterized protein n=1 Tax=Bombardia bombarda TaxID=252184 RepID=A0AA39XBV4_9PEZI|nr:hypothetical protein B0T17DRAFT_491013 [Bombardia bombarda]